MFVFIAILYNNDSMHKLMKKVYEEGYRGSILPTTGLRSALLCSTDEPAPIFGSLSKIVDSQPDEHPALFIIVKNELEINNLKSIVNETLNNKFKGEGFMFAFPVSFVEGIDL